MCNSRKKSCDSSLSMSKLLNPYEVELAGRGRNGSRTRSIPPSKSETHRATITSQNLKPRGEEFDSVLPVLIKPASCAKRMEWTWEDEEVETDADAS
jgi:hypothetical protein